MNYYFYRIVYFDVKGEKQEYVELGTSVEYIKKSFKNGFPGCKIKTIDVDKKI